MPRYPSLSGYRMMWLYVMFDLPVGTKAERKAAMTSTETAVRRAKAVAKRLENLRRELEAEEEAVVTLLLL